ncbi:MAG: LamB/YcsF family protein [Lysobacter sp.]|nr:MAG: LamB/YcsF family protein [Lysobacter sp.]
MHTIDLNCDLGEGCGSDADIVPLISSANIACGAHAGDASTIRATLRLCAAHGVAAGAHPGYADREHFGRRETGDDADAIARSVTEQLAHFAALAREAGIAVSHVKLHGALYNRAAEDLEVADAIVRTVRAFDPATTLFGLSGSALLMIAAEAGLRVAHEVFPDRGYDLEGRLLPRSRPDAVIAAPEEVADRAFLLAGMGLAKDERGRPLMLRADTLCLHGDRDDAVAIAQAVRERLDRAGLRIVAPTTSATP